MTALLIAQAASAPAEPSADEAPLSDEELALVAALTTTTAPLHAMPRSPLVPGARGSRLSATLARTTAEALDNLPTLFRTYRGRDRLTLWRDGVRLPLTHGFQRLQDGWLMLDPGTVEDAIWDSGPGLGAHLTLDAPPPPRDGWQANVTALARSADRGLGARGRVGFGNSRRGVVVGGRAETLPTTRLQTSEQATNGDRLGQQYALFFRAVEVQPKLTVGVDWLRREDAQVKGPRPQEQARVEHAVAFARLEGAWGQAVVAYLRDEIAGSNPRSTDRAQVSAEGRWSLGRGFSLALGAAGHFDAQRFAAVSGTAIRAEPWLAAMFARFGYRVRLEGRALWGSVSTSADADLDGLQPTFRLEAAGPFGAGFGWRIAFGRDAHLPQPWNLPTTGRRDALETSWHGELGPTWFGKVGFARLTGFAQRIDNFWPRAAVVINDRQSGRIDVIGVEAEWGLRVWRGLEIQAGAGWAEDDVKDPAFIVTRPASANLRGAAAVRYQFSSRSAFVEAHLRWLTSTISTRTRQPSTSTGDSPVRLGLSGGVDLGGGFSLLATIVNVVDAYYDDPSIDRDQVGLDARVAVTYAPLTGARP